MHKKLKTLIGSLDENDFKELIKAYIKEKYKTSHVRIVDGPYDGGNDLEIIKDGIEIKKNIQITVQKINYEKKLDEDLQKAKDNVKNYSYINVLEFYINQPISKEKRNELQLNAEVKFQITLKIVDSNILSQEAETYNSISDFTYSAHDIETPIRNIDRNDKILFDVLTLDKDSVEIKRNFINSYILSFLYNEPNTNVDQIFAFINPHLNNNLDKNFLEKELNYLRTQNQLVSETNKALYKLSDQKYAEISAIYSKVTEEEEIMYSMLDDFTKENDVKSTPEELRELLYKLYQENYKIDIEEINSTNNSFDASIRKSFNDLIAFFAKKGISNTDGKIYAKKLLESCQNSDFLNKLSTIHLFNNLYASNKLEKYIYNKTQEILLDTQILIRLIPIIYDSKIKYTDPALQSVKILFQTLQKYKDGIRLKTTYDYVGEVARHMYEAIKLQRFLSLPYISKLGTSKNVYFNAYLNLKQNDLIDADLDFANYISELIGEEINEDNEDAAIKKINRRLTRIYEIAGLELIAHPTYPNFSELRKEYELTLDQAFKDRSFIARENDLRTILYLSSKQNHTNPKNGEYTEPFLVTWDSAFYPFRKKIGDNHKDFGYWYIYTPLKVVDRFSVMNFNLNPKSISLNIIALTESNFNYNTKNSSFLDVISSYFNTKDVSNLTIINKLVDLQLGLQNVEEVAISPEFTDDKDSSTLTILLSKLRSHYNSLETSFIFQDIIKIFESPKFENDIIEIFKTVIESYKTEMKLDMMYKSFDNLIETDKELGK